MASLPTNTAPRKGESFHARTYRLMALAFLALFGLLVVGLHSKEGRIASADALEDYDDNEEGTPSSPSAPAVETTTSVTVASQQQDFREVARKTGTDKVEGNSLLSACLDDNEKCFYPQAVRPKCRTWGHFYDTMYNRWIGKYSTPDADPIQLLEIGYYNGKGFEAYTNFLPNAELHSMEISCIPEGPRSENKWPWGNFAEKHRWYKDLRANDRLHCGDASDYNFLKEIWTKKMKRDDAPPLMVVIDDGSHLHDQMAESLFFWFPRIQPGGILVVEDVQPITAANKFRTHIVPQAMKDLHWCGGGGKVSVDDDPVCFPTIRPLLEGIHCEMHICVFVRNNEPAYEPVEAQSKTPATAFTGAQKCLFGPHK